MTREEAKGILEEIKINDDCLTQYIKGFDEALDMAIQALEREPVNTLTQQAYEDGKKDGYLHAKAEQATKTVEQTGRWIDWEYGTVYCSVCGKFNNSQ